MNYQILSLLSQVPSKKYIRKLMEYAYLFKNKLYCFQEFMETPVSAQMPQDLQFDEKQAHQMIFSLVHIIEQSEQLGWNHERILELFPQGFDETLKQNIIDAVLQLAPLCDKLTNREICQADSLIDIDWRVDVNVAQNTPVLFLQFETLNIQTNKKDNVTFQLNQNEVNNFHNNLVKIKEQLQTLTK